VRERERERERKREGREGEDEKGVMLITFLVFVTKCQTQTT
jgi:hypothetical protein